MGSWLAKELIPDNEVAVFDTDKKKTDSLRKYNIKLLNEQKDIGQFDPDMIINAVNIENTIEGFNQIFHLIKENCIICDLASIKGDLPEYYKKCKRKFVSLHPMFGPTFSVMSNLKEENAVIIKESCPEGKDFFRSFFNALNLNIFEYSFEDHDKMMAYSLSLPFISSIVFAACMTDKAVPGSTFARHKKIADGLLSEDKHLLSEILFNDHSLSQLDKVTSKLEFLKHIIRAKDYEVATDFFEKLQDNIR
jgi:prephenate dehydrogenase